MKMNQNIRMEELKKAIDIALEEYDKETNFSINKVKQEEWLKKVSHDLSELKNYSNYN